MHLEPSTSPLSESDILIGEERTTGTSQKIHCILRAVKSGQVSSTVVASESAFIKVGDILNWTEARWRSYPLITEGIRIPESPIQTGDDEGASREEVEEEIGREDVSPNEISPTSEEVSRGKVIETPPSEELIVPKTIQKKGWTAGDFVKRGGMVRLSQDGNTKLRGLQKEVIPGLLEEFRGALEEEGFTFITAH